MFRLISRGKREEGKADDVEHKVGGQGLNEICDVIVLSVV